MELELKQVRNTLIVRIEGELDMLAADQIREDIDKKIDNSEIKNLILNERTLYRQLSLGMIIVVIKKLARMDGCLSRSQVQVENFVFSAQVN